MKPQGLYKDVVYAYCEVKNAKGVLRGSRSNVDSFHNQIHTRARIARSVGMKESRPGLAKRATLSKYPCTDL